MFEEHVARLKEMENEFKAQMNEMIKVSETFHQQMQNFTRALTRALDENKPTIQGIEYNYFEMDGVPKVITVEPTDEED